MSNLLWVNLLDELATKDVKKAKEFYGNVFGWKV